MVDKANLHAILRADLPGRPALIAAYVALIYVADNKSGEASKSLEQLAELAAQSVRSLRTKLEQLHALGLIAIDSTFVGGRQTRNTYTLLDAPVAPPKEPPRRGRLVIAPQLSPATVAPLIPISPATVAPPSPATVAPHISRKNVLEGVNSMSSSASPARARATQQLELEPPPPYRAIHPSIKAQIIRDGLAKLHGGIARHVLPGPLAAATWERHEKRLRIRTSDAQCARLARQNAGVFRVSAAELLDCRKLELEILYEVGHV